MSEEILGRAIIAIVLLSGGILALWLARATATGKITRNELAGIRTPATMASDRAWLAAHRAAEPPTRIGGWCAIVSVIPAFLPVPLGFAVISVLAGAVAMVAFALYGAAVGSRAARDLPPEHDAPSPSAR